jgi:hypothetical protein
MTLIDWVGIAAGVFALICVCLPCRYDPAIRWKEHLEGWPAQRRIVDDGREPDPLTGLPLETDAELRDRIIRGW